MDNEILVILVSYSVLLTHTTEVPDSIHCSR
jgi:hypothetical protein